MPQSRRNVIRQRRPRRRRNNISRQFTLSTNTYRTDTPVAVDFPISATSATYSPTFRQLLGEFLSTVDRTVKLTHVSIRFEPTAYEAALTGAVYVQLNQIDQGTQQPQAISSSRVLNQTTITMLSAFVRQANFQSIQSTDSPFELIIFADNGTEAAVSFFFTLTCHWQMTYPSFIAPSSLRRTLLATTPSITSIDD